MAEELPTLLDVAKMTGTDAVVGLIDETTKDKPELAVGAARTIRGQSYKTLVRTEVPRGNSFRNANDGVDAVKGNFENRRVETYIFNKRFKIDKAVADKNEDGPGVLLARHSKAVLDGGMLDLAAQFYYGNSGDFAEQESGFPGLMQSYDATNMVVDAGGTTDNTASSVWLVKFGDQGVQWVWGENGELALSEPRIESITGQNGSPLDGYLQNFQAYPGLQVASPRAVVRIKNLTKDDGKGLTDQLFYDALDLFPTGWEPDAIFLTRRSLGQWRSSRTATNATGAPAPTPTNFEGIRAYKTEMIRNDENLAW